MKGSWRGSSIGVSLADGGIEGHDLWVGQGAG
jgi:hypothetical protein